MENRYYTPEIEEFHVGFEYESFETPLTPSFAFETKPAEWLKRKVLDINNSEYKGKALYHVSINNRYEENVEWNKNIRVKYLDEQDILDCGFIKENGQLDKFGYLFFNNGNYMLTFYPPNPTFIEIENSEEEFQQFIGTVKNKSELKKLLKQLGL